MRLPVLILLGLFSFVLSAPAVELTAVSPSTVFPGTRVILAGGPFAGDVSVILGNRRVGVEEVAVNRLSFIVPALPAGEYLLAVEQGGGRSTGAFTLRVVLPPPRIHALDPGTVDLCTPGGTPRIAVSGSNFLPGVALLYDNAALPVERASASELLFSVPELKVGLHQVQAVNPDNQRSLPTSFTIDGTPEIDSVELGEDRTVEYELVVRGKNFAFNSQLLVNGAPVGRGGGAPVASLSQVQRDALRFVDCATLIYLRHPFMRDVRELALQVVTPGAPPGNTYLLTAP